ncbi:MAG: hypothetical protein J6Y20_07090 [Lachnospiraceae bacterium]|nr:hypothetical protein [Lachnospiraceae bacterium]
MITCKLGEKEYFIDHVSGRALREIGPAIEQYARIKAVAEKAVKGEEITESFDMKDAMDVMVKWFCIVFNNQFSMDEFYDQYPADNAIHDIMTAILAVQTGTTEVLSEFPMKAATAEGR